MLEEERRGKTGGREKNSEIENQGPRRTYFVRILIGKWAREDGGPLKFANPPPPTPPPPPGEALNSFIRRGSAPRPDPSLFYIPFLLEKAPLSYTFHRKWYPFHVPTERLLLNFSPTWMNQTLGASVRDILKDPLIRK